MGNFENRILKIIDSHPNGIKAKDIAQIMGCDRKDVNSALFGRLKGLCIQDNAFLWHLADSKSAKTPEHKAAADKRLSDLCRYYLNCLSLEESGGISAFLTSKYWLLRGIRQVAQDKKLVFWQAVLVCNRQPENCGTREPYSSFERVAAEI